MDGKGGAASGEARQPKLAYWDTNIWVDLAKRLNEEPEAWRPVLTDFVEARDTGRLEVALTATQYLELWHRRAFESRERVGSVMKEISNYAALSPIQRVQELEIAVAIDQFLSEEAHPVVRADVLGRGVNHAFDSPLGRLRMVESIATETEPEGPPTQPPPGLMEHAHGPTWEWFSLVGSPDMPVDGMDRTPEHRLGTKFVQEELARREWLRNNPGSVNRVGDFIIAEELLALGDVIVDLCERRGVSPQRVLGDASNRPDPQAMRRFAATVPTLDVLVTLRAWKHRDLSHPWEQHDKADLMALCVAVPYCDFVVTERRWAHLIRASGLATKYKTTLLSGIKGLHTFHQMVTTCGPET